MRTASVRSPPWITMASLLKELEKLGGGLFITHKGGASRLCEDEMWLAFEEPVIVWVHGPAFSNSEIERLVEIAKKLPYIQRFRFTDTSIKQESLSKLRQHWPGVPIEY